MDYPPKTYYLSQIITKKLVYVVVRLKKVLNISNKTYRFLIFELIKSAV